MSTIIFIVMIVVIILITVLSAQVSVMRDDIRAQRYEIDILHRQMRGVQQIDDDKNERIKQHNRVIIREINTPPA